MDGNHRERMGDTQCKFIHCPFDHSAYKSIAVPCRGKNKCVFGGTVSESETVQCFDIGHSLTCLRLLFVG